MRKCEVFTSPLPDRRWRSCPWLAPVKLLLEQRPERAVEGAGGGLQPVMGAAAESLHLLALGKMLSGHFVEGACAHNPGCRSVHLSDYFPSFE